MVSPSRRRMRRPAAQRELAGRREWIGFPDLGIADIKAKIDTGARTSAIHAFKVNVVETTNGLRAHFFVHPVQGRRLPQIACEAPIVDERLVASSSGHRERRYVIETSLRMGSRQWPIELSLANRDEMGFRVLLGRQALRRRLIVDPGRSYRLSNGDGAVNMFVEKGSRP